MPIHEYECQACKFYTEVMQKITDAPLTQCPSCGKRPLRKLVSAPVFRLKGGGWYETDFKSAQENSAIWSRREGGAEADVRRRRRTASLPRRKAKDAKPADAKPVESKPAAPKTAARRQCPAPAAQRVSVSGKAARAAAAPQTDRPLSLRAGAGGGPLAMNALPENGTCGAT